MQIDTTGFADAANQPDAALELFSAGTSGAGEYTCADCGYGISIRAALPICPMCRGSAWDPAPHSPS